MNNSGERVKEKVPVTLVMLAVTSSSSNSIGRSEEAFKVSVVLNEAEIETIPLKSVTRVHIPWVCV